MLFHATHLDNDALDEAVASAIKIDSYDFTPLCE